ncbi:hypothetical protein [Pedococcus dokdonensis]|nr:hypothetical protein [Pedococcus dokdonensis]
MSPAVALALSAVSQAKSLVALAQALGWVRSSTARSLEAIDGQLRLALEAPLHEGLDRIELAARLDNATRQQELLTEAQSKLHDVAARPGMPATVVALACVTCASLAQIRNNPEEARIWVARALDAYDRCLQEAHRDASKAALMNVGETVSGAPAPFPRAIASRVKRRVGILRESMRESSESVRSLTIRINEINAEVSEAHAFAADLGVALDGRCREVTLRTFKALIVLVKLNRVHPAAAS